MSTVISIEDVSKLYCLGEIGTGSLAHDINRWWHKFRGNEDPYLKVGQSNDRATKGDSDFVYAIKDVSFTVKQGEVLGIIGRNGAGKSTLLKILSRVTTPTSGQIKVKGRIASLLEVGTGFHPELTGRENIFLNGAILGMRKAEIKAKFDEIVAFSGCERYIDTPVKRYSSGMYVRLAFAVAAHLEPEILIVDEVLAVGDTEFQKKCIGKMKSVAGEGRTVIFVSHNLSAVENLCNSGIVMRNGRIETQGSASDAISYYMAMEESSNRDSSALRGIEGRSGLGRIRLREVGLKTREGSSVSTVAAGSSLMVQFICENCTNAPIDNVSVGYSISNQMDQMLVIQYSDYESQLLSLAPGLSTVEVLIKNLPLSNGVYSIGARILVNGFEEDWPQFTVANLHIDGGVYGGNAANPHSGRGNLLLENEWSTRAG